MATHTAKPQPGRVEERRSRVLGSPGSHEDLSPARTRTNSPLRKVLAFLCLRFPLFIYGVFKTGSLWLSLCLHQRTWSSLQLKRGWLCKAVNVPPGIWQAPATHQWPCKDRCIFMTGTAVPLFIMSMASPKLSDPPASSLGITLREVADARTPGC